MKQPYHSRLLEEHIKELTTLFPQVHKNVIGYSVLGKPIHELTIGQGKKKVHWNGAFHANEWITSSVIMYNLLVILEGIQNQKNKLDKVLTNLLEDVELSIVPMVNPDGVDLVVIGPPSNEPYLSEVFKINEGQQDFSDWKANIRGIDLNNQFPAKWEIEKERKIPKSPANRDFPGSFPLSEPEVIAIQELTLKRQFDRVVAFHTQGKEMYWGYEGKECSYAKNVVEEFAKWSKYAPVQYIDSHAGYKDWFILEFEKEGYTIELGEGVNPLPLEQFDQICEESLGIFLASIYM